MIVSFALSDAVYKHDAKKMASTFMEAKPKDCTPEEVERTRLAAVESRRKLEEKYFTMEKITMKQIANKKQQEKTICTSMLLCIYMHGESGCDSEVIQTTDYRSSDPNEATVPASPYPPHPPHPGSSTSLCEHRP